MDPRGTNVTLRLQERPPRRNMQGEPWHLILSFRVCSHWIFSSTFCFLWVLNCFCTDRLQMCPKMRPPFETANGAKGLTCLSLIRSPAGWAPLALLMYCCFKLKRKLLPKHHLFQFYKRNKYLSTKIAHLSDHKWGWPLHWSPDVRDLCLFSIWAGQSLRKYVLSRRAATNWTAAHVSMGAYSSVFSLSLHRISHISYFSNSLVCKVALKKRMQEMMTMTNTCVQSCIAYQCTCVRNLKSWVTFGQRR